MNTVVNTGIGRDPATPPITYLTHNRITLALHRLREGDGRPLLLLHGLGEQSPTSVPVWAAAWPGPVAALDFTGHGRSTVPRGGGYSSEMLLGDADAAIAELGEATVLGRGLGAYIALQIAGGRARQVIGAVLCDGPGLAGGPTEPTSQTFLTLHTSQHRPGRSPDPYALVELGRDLRPPDYATSFVRLALQGSRLDDPITVAAVFKPAWLEAVVAERGVGEASIGDALTTYAAAPALG
jgi:pimeloyl-ACP methyl ester carboxylesterase